MAWLDLQTEILGEFADVSTTWRPAARLEKHFAYIAEVERVRKRDYMRAKAPATRARRTADRIARANARPPCPRCGCAVERVGKSARLPKYCSPRCMHAERFARWYAKHGAERNERRRAGTRGVAS